MSHIGNIYVIFCNFSQRLAYFVHNVWLTVHDSVQCSIKSWRVSFNRILRHDLSIILASS